MGGAAGVAGGGGHCGRGGADGGGRGCSRCRARWEWGCCGWGFGAGEGCGYRDGVARGDGGGGEFVVARVPAGECVVSVEAGGFERALVGRVAVQVGGVAEVDVQLKVEGVSTSVSVSAEAGLEDASSTALASVAAGSEIDSLPVNGRRWQSFALLGPVASADATGDDLLSFRGLPATQNSTTLDGVSDDRSFSAVPRGAGGDAGNATEDEEEGGFSSATGQGRAMGIGTGRRVGADYTFSQEAVREFRVSVQNYSAVYGHGAGGVISTVSKSGTNEMHGAGFYLARTSALGAANPFSVATSYADGVVTSGVVKPNDLRQQFGGSVGGAILRDKLFYFYTLDLLRRNYPAVSTPGYAGFYALTSMQTALLSNRGVTAAQTNAALNYLNSLTGMVARRQDQDINFIKTDWQAAQRHRLSVEYNRARMDAPAGARSGAVVDRGMASLGSSYVNVDAVMGRWMWTRGDRVSNEVRVHFGRELEYETAQAPLPQEPAIGPDGFAPEVSIGPQGLIFGTPASLGRKAYPDERRVEVRDLATWVMGRHVVQVGGDVSFVHDETDSLSNVDGTFSYDSGVTKGKAGGLVDWITDYTFNVHAYPNGGCPSIVSAVHDFCFRSYTQSFGQQTVAFDTQEWAGFVEDTWRVRQGLSVKVGMRYEYELLPFPQRPNTGLDAVFGKTGATSVFPEDRNNVGLRVGVGWEPLGAGKGVVRVGYGEYFGRLRGGDDSERAGEYGDGEFGVECEDCAEYGYRLSAGGEPGFWVCVQLCDDSSGGGGGDYFGDGVRPAVPAAGGAAGESCGGEECGQGVTLSATYLMNLDRQLQNSVDINIAPSTDTQVFQLSGGTGVPGVQDGYTFTVPVYTSRVSTSYGPVTDIVSNANAVYNAMVLEGRRRTRGGVEFRVGWTWAKAIDYGQTGGAVPRTNGQFDPFNVSYDRGLSAYGHSHRVVASAVWEPRVAAGERWVRRAVNGWAVAPVFTESSGRPYSYDIFGGSYLSGGRESINGSGGAVYLPTVGRDTLRLPDTANVDLRVSRGVRVGERVLVRGVAEVFNVTNRVNYSGVTERAFLVGTAVSGVTPLVFQDAAAVATEGLNVRPFGAYTAAGTGGAAERQVQVGLRLEF